MVTPAEHVVLPPVVRSKQIQPRDTLPSIRSLYPEIEERRHHFRTTSLPLVLPSEEQRLSMTVLLDAIDLEQRMRLFYKEQCVKSVIRDHMNCRKPSGKMTFKASSRFLQHSLRRRSKSAPGAPLAYYYTASARWSVPGSGLNDNMPTVAVAKSIVEKHIDCARRRG
ncbi:hypothetical protein EC973_006916 [Apophysomyces ossiformis]|uniref:Uncharacterized protein n=1 Tax=Apophysomyces ossiformis TaxID=679940 RepID=A0A8H7BVQ5_9FUNG|nr:hypothetical protein EC973_006916 [Apophysomyces ossiformis]